jgi:hypothetical protein
VLKSWLTSSSKTRPSGSATLTCCKLRKADAREGDAAAGDATKGGCVDDCAEGGALEDRAMDSSPK